MDLSLLKETQLDGDVPLSSSVLKLTETLINESYTSLRRIRKADGRRITDVQYNRVKNSVGYQSKMHLGYHTSSRSSPL